MVLDPETLDLAPLAPVLLERLGLAERYKLELPASQLEITSPSCGGRTSWLTRCGRRGSTRRPRPTAWPGSPRPPCIRSPPPTAS